MSGVTVCLHFCCVCIHGEGLVARTQSQAAKKRDFQNYKYTTLYSEGRG